MSQRILIIGATGALGGRLAVDLTAGGGRVTGTYRSEGTAAWQFHLDLLDGISPIRQCITGLNVALVVNCAADTDVAGIESVRRIGSVNDAGAYNLAQACLAEEVPLLHLSSDYAAGPWTQYGRLKRDGERAVLEAGGSVARVAHLPPEKACAYTWLNGYTRSNREWTGRCARRLAAFLADVGYRPEPGRLYEVGPATTATVADLVRDRWPRHRALQRVLTDPAEIRALCGFDPPADTTFRAPWAS